MAEEKITENIYSAGFNNLLYKAGDNTTTFTDPTLSPTNINLLTAQQAAHVTYPPEWEQLDVSQITYSGVVTVPNYTDNYAFLLTFSGISPADIVGFGDRIRIYQGGVARYFYITHVDSTSIECLGNRVINGTTTSFDPSLSIEQAHFSKIDSPAGMPTTFTFSPATDNATITGSGTGMNNWLINITGDRVSILTNGTRSITFGGVAALEFIFIAPYKLYTSAIYQTNAIMFSQPSALSDIERYAGFLSAFSTSGQLRFILSNAKQTNFTIGGGNALIFTASISFFHAQT